MDTMQINILNPKAIELLKDLAARKLIAIHETPKNEFEQILNKLRSDSDSSPILEEITNEVEIVRSQRYAKSKKQDNY